MVIREDIVIRKEHALVFLSPMQMFAVVMGVVCKITRAVALVDTLVQLVIHGVVIAS
jgi:hypothetical protein